MLGFCTECHTLRAITPKARFFGRTVDYAPVEHDAPDPLCPGAGLAAMDLGARACCSKCSLSWLLPEEGGIEAFYAALKAPWHTASVAPARCRGSGKVIK